MAQARAQRERMPIKNKENDALTHHRIGQHERVGHGGMAFFKELEWSLKGPKEEGKKKKAH